LNHYEKIRDTQRVLLHKYFSGILTGRGFYQVDHMNDCEADD